MSQHTILVFDPYPLEAGQKIHIRSGQRKGDWEVVSVDDRNVTLRCPISDRQVKWNRFCYFVEERVQAEWPSPD
ncbi:MAG: hypothetical protein V2A58_08855 [Planctomycetota bacterium]